MKKHRLVTTLTLLAFACHQAVATMKVPDGFQELAAGQVMWVDVSLYGKPLGLFQANVDLENVRFMKPEALANAVSEKYNGAPELHALVVRALASPLPRNGNLACQTNGDAPGCGYVNTKTVAVIYDENDAAVSLVLNKQYLPVHAKEDNYYHATADSHNALVHQQNVNFVADRDYQSASVQGNGSLGVTDNGYVNVDWNWQGQRYREDSYQRADVNNAYFRQDLWKRVYLQGGIMDSRDIFSNAGGSINLSQLPIGRIKGVRAGSTLAWVDQQKSSRVTELKNRNKNLDRQVGEAVAALNAARAQVNTLTLSRSPSAAEGAGPDLTALMNKSPAAVGDYATGVSFGREINHALMTNESLGVHNDGALVLLGIADVIHKKLRLSFQDVENGLTDAQKSVRLALESTLKEQAATGQKATTAFLKKKGAVKADSGFLYRIVKAGSGDLPANEPVRVVVNESLADGTPVQDMQHSGQEIAQKVSAFPPVFKEVLEKLKNHGEADVLVPPALAYGDSGYPPKIPPGATMLYTIKITGVGNSPADVEVK